MSILKAVLKEMFGMFIGDVRQTLAILAVVAVAATLVRSPALSPLVGGGVLLIGSVIVLIAMVRIEALRRRRK